MSPKETGGCKAGKAKGKRCALRRAFPADAADAADVGRSSARIRRIRKIGWEFRFSFHSLHFLYYLYLNFAIALPKEQQWGALANDMMDSYE